MDERDKQIFQRIEEAVDRVAAKYRSCGDHDGDMMADAFDDLSNELALGRMGLSTDD